MASKKSRIVICLMIAVLMISMLMLVSCGNESKTADNNDIRSELGGEDTGNSGNSGDSTSANARIEPDLDENANFGAHVFKVFSRDRTEPDWVDWVARDIVYSEEDSGDTINDAVYKRNTYVEDKYNFKIELVLSTNHDSEFKKLVKAGDDAYDMVQFPMRDTPALAQAGNFLNLFDVPNLDLDKPWWDQGANKELSFGGKLYFTSGDIMMMNNDTCTGFVFNKELLKDLGLEDPYPIVKAGKWTMDKLYDLCKDASRDLNGDGKMDYLEDRYGLIGQRDTLISFLHGANEYITQKDENDYPRVIFGSERSISAMEACFKVMYEGDITHNAHHLEGKVPGIYPVSEDMFMSNRALFMWVRLRIVENLRSMDKDFGILPIPKLNEAQDDYYTDVISHTGQFMTIPMTAADPARTGHILEAICAESKYTTMPAYYEITLKTKMARDEDSSDMLDIIFKNRVWDIGEIANFGDFSGQLIHMSMKNNSDIVSLFDKHLPRMEKDIDKAITNYEKLD